MLDSLERYRLAQSLLHLGKCFRSNLFKEVELNAIVDAALALITYELHRKNVGGWPEMKELRAWVLDGFEEGQKPPLFTEALIV